MLTSIRPITVLPAKLPRRPDIIINEVAIPRYFDGNKLTPTAIAIFAIFAKQINSKKLIIVHLNSVRKFSVLHAIIDIINQTPKKEEKKAENLINQRTAKKFLPNSPKRIFGEIFFNKALDRTDVMKQTIPMTSNISYVNILSWFKLSHLKSVEFQEIKINLFICHWTAHTHYWLHPIHLWVEWFHTMCLVVHDNFEVELGNRVPICLCHAKRQIKRREYSTFSMCVWAMVA